MANDVITELDGEEVQGLTLDQAIDKMRGPVNTKINLTIMRKGQDKPIEIRIVRDVIRVRSVRSHSLGDDIGYIRCGSASNFDPPKLSTKRLERCQNQVFRAD